MARLDKIDGKWINTDRPGGAVFFVSGGTSGLKGLGSSDGNLGTRPEEPLSTIQGGLDKCVSGRGDTVAITPGSITITAALTMTLDDVTLTSAQPSSPLEYGSVVVVDATAATSMLTINANNCEVNGLVFDDNVAAATADTGVIMISTANTGELVTGTVIRNCYLDMLGSDSDRDGICVGLTTDATDAAPHTLIEGTTILDCDQDAIVINVGSNHSAVRGCLIYDTANTTRFGVELLALQCQIQDNTIWTSTASGACVHNGIAAARALISGNKLAGFTTTTYGLKAIATATQVTLGNWIGSGATAYVNDYTTDNTTPSSDANISGFFAGTPGATALNVPSVT